MEQEEQQQDMTQEQHETDDQSGTSEQELSTEASSSHTMVIVAVIAIVVVVLALMYMWGSNIQRKQLAEEAPKEAPPTLPQDDAQTEALKQVNSSDEVDAIAEDLENTELEALDAELIELEAELDAALEA